MKLVTYGIIILFLGDLHRIAMCGFIFSTFTDYCYNNYSCITNFTSWACPQQWKLITVIIIVYSCQSHAYFNIFIFRMSLLFCLNVYFPDIFTSAQNHIYSETLQSLIIKAQWAAESLITVFHLYVLNLLIFNKSLSTDCPF